MANSKQITATEGRLKSQFGNIVNSVVDTQTIEKTIKSATDKVSLRTGKVTKYYPYLDKAEVKLDSSKKRILCKILHRYGGEILDLFTPVADHKAFCNKLKEPCIIPRDTLHCVVANLHDEDSDEHLILGYYQNKELVGLNPASPGNFKLCTNGGTNQYWIKFGYDGLDIRAGKNPTMNIGKMNNEMATVEYAKTGAVYTKTELDKIINGYEARIKRLEDIIEKNHLDTNTTDNTGNGGS